MLCASTFLSLGAGGGQDVYQALQDGAKEIHAVEVISHLNELMQDGELAEFSGYIYKAPRVVVISEDARAYVRRFTNKFDLIYSFSSNSFAALASGAFALAENYLYTTEAFIDYWNALSENGYMLISSILLQTLWKIIFITKWLLKVGNRWPIQHRLIFHPQMTIDRLLPKWVCGKIWISIKWKRLPVIAIGWDFHFHS